MSSPFPFSGRPASFPASPTEPMSNSPPSSDPLESFPKVELRDARLAAFLAWLVPGLGHIYQRRYGKGLLFMIAILGIFGYGMWLGNGRVVYVATVDPIGNFGKFRERWHYICQIGVGLPALSAIVQTWRIESGDKPLGDFERPPYTTHDVYRIWSADQKQAAEKENEIRRSNDQTERKNPVLHQGELQKWQHDLGFRWEVATVYTMMAGLLNVLAICDARWGPLFHLPHKKSPPEPDDTKPDSDK